MPDRDGIPGQFVNETGCPFCFSEGSPLTTRETEVLGLAAAGKTMKAIALQIDRSQKTVKNQLRLIREKLNAQNTTHAVAVALSRGLIKLDT